MDEQKKLTDKIMLSSNVDFVNSSLYVPIIISEYNFDKFDNKCIDIKINTFELSRKTQTSIKNVVMPNVENLNWQKENDINKEVKSEFSKLLSGSNASQRIKDTLKNLFLANNFQTVKKQQS